MSLRRSPKPNPRAASTDATGVVSPEPAAPPPGDWYPLVLGDERRFHPVYVSLHDDGLLLTFGRAFGERAWERTKTLVKESGAQFVRGLEGWLLPTAKFALDRGGALTVLASAEAREAIVESRRVRESRFDDLPPAARYFRPALRELTVDEIRVHPALRENEKTFVCDVRAKRLEDLSARQRDWLKRIDERHRARLEEDPAWIAELFAARAARVASIPGIRPASEPAPAPAVPEAPPRARAARSPARAPEPPPSDAPSPMPAGDSPPIAPPEERARAARRTPRGAAAPTPTPSSRSGSKRASPNAKRIAPRPPPPAIDEDELAVFHPRIDELHRDDLRRFPIFRPEDRAEIRKLLGGGTSMWTSELQARLDGFLEAHPEALRALFEAKVARRLAEEARLREATRLEAAKDDDHLALPRGFRREALSTGDLHAYQKRGVRWLLAVKRGILAHDVGLGKTLQAITAAAALMDAGEARRALVVVPKPRLVGWEREIRRFTDRDVVAVFGDRDERVAAYERARRVPFVIVGYHALQREVPELTALGAEIFVVDEAHRLKGSKTLASAGFARLAHAAPYVFFLTATPMPNHPEELHALMAHLEPGLLGSLWGEFASRYAIVERLRLRGRRRPVFHIKGYKHLDELKERVSPYVFLKTAADPDVALDLPPLREMVVELGLATEQEKLYRDLKQDAAKTLAAIDPRRFGPRERASLLTHILRLEQVAISPLLVDHAYRGASPKLDEASELILERLERGAPGTIVFCRFLDALGALRRILEQRGVASDTIASIEGSVPAARIDEIEQGFRAGRYRVLLASDAAREGLNLQDSADLLIHLDVPWVPNVVHQRNGRIHRQGQTRPVTIMHFRSPRTIEERKVATLRRKSAWIADVLGTGVTEVETALTIEDLRLLLADDVPFE
ncbi:MAG: DEAD/DEAH box helicase [Deltaproteobacteria bacterium]|nr:DEAD/DEAH box helicase [Deltaproteobacteria bacterium]